MTMRLQSSAELLALPNYFNVIRAIFNEHPNEKLKCPNETCSREFTNTQSIISHAQNCALTKTRRSRKKDSSSPNRAHKKREAPKQYECYRDYKGHASSWAVLSTADKMSLITNEFERSKIKRIPCLNPDCSLRMKEVDEVLDHVNRCYLPEYFTYLVSFFDYRIFFEVNIGSSFG
uniref:C2H2-type domain-containing protein n=1 Tax=Ascaris lumbricoides TaxID=6252 RepID=A0A0M3HZV6_ASCLU